MPKKVCEHCHSKTIEILYKSTFPFFPGLFWLLFFPCRETAKSKIYEFAVLAMQKFICLKANVETGVSLIPLKLYLFSSPVWNIPLALWSVYKEELFRSQLEEGQFKTSHQHGWFPTNCQLTFYVCI